jgi:FkbM family methyltransferase
MIDLPFIFRNYAGLLLARTVERVPGALSWLRRSHSRLKPSIASRLRGSRFKRELIEQVGPFRMRLRLEDNVQRWIYLGLYENEEIETCRRSIGPGTTCVDVGANVGWFTLHFASWVGVSGRVIACEADPHVAEELRQNCQLNAFADRVEILNSAVSDLSGTVRFIRSPRESSGWGSVLRQPGNQGGTTIDIPATTLDEILLTREIRDVAYLKIDVEGYEFAVLKGAARSLSAGIIRNVLIEWVGASHTLQGESLEKMDAVFRTSGYVPDEATDRVFHDIAEGKTDPKVLFTNLVYRRSRSPFEQC